MPGSSPYEAFGAFVGPLGEALSCVVRGKITASAGGKNDLNKVHELHLTGIAGDGYVRLRGDRRIEMRARMFYEIIRDPRPGYGPFRITTRGYDYSLRTSDGLAVVDYHWHPLGQSHEKDPHLHIGAAQLRPDSVLSNKDHLPSGRITVESVVRAAIASGATPLQPDWETRLAGTEYRHVLHRSWH
ncbi:hypothetical protein GCM10022251_61800 [Phytohabitans flavus]|uniref:Uncharacterized protein n=1 Tax=Phytohabitans flavus TaxID=1076124 RepID=A0A6F8Y5N2_9ACTN|nr:hypothetical protein [Phytohabitans flavus]BCB81333.1 hypothetical protein Pflav_077430 [Phytohabitans flavus]